MKPWKVLERAPVYRADPWLSVERQKVELPDGRIIDDYHRITFPDCAGVVAHVSDGRIMVQRQYRHGPGRVCLTLPGGAMNPGESPLQAAQRELREETGYEARDWKPLGSFTLNANYGCGTMHIFSATDAERTGQPDNEDLEESAVLLLPPAELHAAIDRGEVAVLAAAVAILLATRGA
jgi:ADP-ribose pyrophosphatase